MGMQLPSANFDLSGLSIDRLNTDQVDLARFARMAHRIYPELPGWLQQGSSIYALYIIFAGVLVITLLCYYTTIETIFIGSSKSGFNRAGKFALLFWDVLFTFLSYQILTA
jgi:hypothetical protein